MSSLIFDQDFKQLTGYPPFIWQIRLYEQHFKRGDIPQALDIPTGLGKTSVMAIWYLALKNQAKLPKRLVYVVDRRAVVDQATTEAEKLRHNSSSDLKLRISTLRGQHVDNKEWLENPSEPAIIVGTVDMIGSRILFSGYGVSRKMRAYHAGLIGVDTLFVLDEAHLVPAFESLVKTINQNLDKFGPLASEDQRVIPAFSLLSLSATGREVNTNQTKVFKLSADDEVDEIVQLRLQAVKRLVLIRLAETDRLVDHLVQQAFELEQSASESQRILVYCNSRKEAVKVKVELDKLCRRVKLKAVSQLLVGGRRLLERNQLAEWLERYGFSGTATDDSLDCAVFLVATSAGEVGVDLDAHHMVCDLVSLERMIQRLGRVNRRGKHRAEVKVLIAKTHHDNFSRPFKYLPASTVSTRRQDMYAAQDLERVLEPTTAYDASPGAFVDLKNRAYQDHLLQQVLDQAISEIPLHPPLTRQMIDAWSMTTLEEHTARPKNITPWLRGWQSEDQPQTTIIWRKYLPVALNCEDYVSDQEIQDFFNYGFPHASEKLEIEVSSTVEWLFKRAKQKNFLACFFGEEAVNIEQPLAFVLSDSMERRITVTVADLVNIADKKRTSKFKDRLKQGLVDGMLIVDQRCGGLSEQGMLDEKSDHLPLVIDDQLNEADGDDNSKDVLHFPDRHFRIRQVNGVETDDIWQESYRFALEKNSEGEVQKWLVIEKQGTNVTIEDDRATGRAQELQEHHKWTMHKAQQIAQALDLPASYMELLVLAARLHDEGKRHELWQEAFHAPQDGKVYAKTVGPVHARKLDGYRHEFGSLSYVKSDPGFIKLDPQQQDLVLHLVAAHHGWARPIISSSGGHDAPSVLAQHKLEVAMRFATLQKQWGPWGLAWWESLLRAADQQASRDNDQYHQLQL